MKKNAPRHQRVLTRKDPLQGKEETRHIGFLYVWNTNERPKPRMVEFYIHICIQYIYIHIHITPPVKPGTIHSSLEIGRSTFHRAGDVDNENTCRRLWLIFLGFVETKPKKPCSSIGAGKGLGEQLYKPSDVFTGVALWAQALISPRVTWCRPTSPGEMSTETLWKVPGPYFEERRIIMCNPQKEGPFLDVQKT